MLTFGLTEARVQLAWIVDQAAGGQAIVLTSRGRPLARVVPLDPPELDGLASEVEQRRAGQEAEWDRDGVPSRDARSGRVLSHLERLELASRMVGLRGAQEQEELAEHVALLTELFERREELTWQVTLLEALLPELGRTGGPPDAK
jgi:prevent-host-death family protein